jgi:exodeoxyribonuclease VII small subunit
MATKTLASKASQTSAELALPASYEAALTELEQLTAQLESGQLPLDQLLTGYQRGAALLKFCRSKLDAVEQQISVIEGDQLKHDGHDRHASATCGLDGWAVGASGTCPNGLGCAEWGSCCQCLI